MSGGWASQLDQRRGLLSYLPFDDEDEEPPYAIADAWTPPHPLALPVDLCDRLVAAAKAAEVGPRPNGSYHYFDLEPDDRQAIVSRFEEANALWWRLDLDRWDVKVKHYADGDRHSEHQDLHARRCSPEAGRVGATEPPRRLRRRRPGDALRRSALRHAAAPGDACSHARLDGPRGRAGDQR